MIIYRYLYYVYIYTYIYIWVHIHIQALREYLVADHHGFVDERDGHLWRNVYVICINVDVYICSYINIFTYIICTWREHVAQLTYKALMMSKAIACDAIWIYMFMYTCIFTYTYIYMYIYIYYNTYMAGTCGGWQTRRWWLLRRSLEGGYKRECEWMYTYMYI